MARVKKIKPVVTILRGISGSGKSTLAKKLAEELSKKNGLLTTICSADDGMMVNGEYKFHFTKLDRAHRSCFVKADTMLEDGLNVIIDNTNTQLYELSPYVMLAKKHHAELEIVQCLCPPDVAADRNVHGVPAESVHAMHDRMEKLPRFYPKARMVVTGD